MNRNYNNPQLVKEMINWEIAPEAYLDIPPTDGYVHMVTRQLDCRPDNYIVEYTSCILGNLLN